MLTLPDKVVDNDVLRRYFGGNRDGAGFAYIKNGKVEIQKGYFSADSFIQEYERLIFAGYNKNPMLIHCRVATLGKVNRDNCHPFKIKDGALIHNGCLWYSPNGYNTEKSDTREFAERLHNVLTYEDISTNKQAVSSAVGAGNKIAMLFNGGKYVILNEENGSWKNGVWYSNTYHLRNTSYS